MASLQIRNLSLEEMPLPLAWAAGEGWNPGLGDAKAFHSADSEGFLAGELDGEVISVISAVRYPEAFNFVGFYIVRPDMRGLGHGYETWKAGMRRASTGNTGLDGVLSEVPNYEKSGFVFAYRNRRYEGMAGGMTLPDGLVDLASVSFDALCAFDREFFPSRREAFLRAWLAAPNIRGMAVEGGRGLEGYGVIRPCQIGWKIGPLFAHSRAVAERIFAGLRSVAGSSLVYLDVPEVNGAGVEMAERAGMKVVFETARMYTGHTPDINLDGIYGVTSFELG